MYIYCVLLHENRIEVEVMKEGDEAGKYLHPEVFGVSEELGVGYEERQKMMEMMEEE